LKSIKKMLYSMYKINFNTIIGTRESRIYSGFICGIIVSLFLGTATAQENNDWPNFHGIQRDNKSTETGLLNQWPETGPELLWTVTGLGEGYSAVSIAGEYIFTAGMIEKQTYVFAYDLNGKQIWKMPNGKAWETTMSHARAYTGSRSTPTYDNGLVYHLGETGRLAAFDYKTGKEIWSRNLPELFDAEIPICIFRININ